MKFASWKFTFITINIRKQKQNNNNVFVWYENNKMYVVVEVKREQVKNM